MKKIQNAGGIYHLRIIGQLDTNWEDWFAGFVIGVTGEDETRLSGVVIDQAHLHGVLSKVCGLNLELKLLLKTPCPCKETQCAFHGDCQACSLHEGGGKAQPFCMRSNTGWDRKLRRAIHIRQVI
jgi:hypothetical protein